MFMVLKMIFNLSKLANSISLADLPQGESAILSELQLNCDVTDHLMNLGFVPGTEVTAVQSGPGGDPRVYRVERTEVALRRDIAGRIRVQLLSSEKTVPSVGREPVLVLSANNASAD